MALLIFILVIIGGAFAVTKLLMPEMYVRIRLPKFEAAPPKVAEAVAIDPSEIMEEQMSVAMPAAAPAAAPAHDILPVAQDINKMELLLLEKNKVIERLQKELDAERSHRGEFDKIRAIMDEEIARLREQLKQAKQQKEPENV